MKRLIRVAAFTLVRPVLSIYLAKKRSYRFGNIKIEIGPGVFHPGFFFSTKFLLGYLLQLDLKGKSLLELGAGSGLTSFVVEKNGALVTASDISETSINGLQINKEKLKSSIHILKSDLFDQIAFQSFDFIIINPPYYPKQPKTDAQRAWYCGENFEYFEKLFSQLPTFMLPQTKPFMVLSAECDMQRIQQIAGLNQLDLKEVEREKIWWEWNYIFEITLNRKIKDP